MSFRGIGNNVWEFGVMIIIPYCDLAQNETGTQHSSSLVAWCGHLYCSWDCQHCKDFKIYVYTKISCFSCIIFWQHFTPEAERTCNRHHSHHITWIIYVKLSAYVLLLNHTYQQINEASSVLYTLYFFYIIVINHHPHCWVIPVRCQKTLDFNGAWDAESGSGASRNSLDGQSSSQIITTRTSTLSFLQAGCPTNSAKPLKGKLSYLFCTCTYFNINYSGDTTIKNYQQHKASTV